MNLLRTLTSPRRGGERGTPLPLALSDYITLLNTFSYQGNAYQLGSKQEEIGGDYRSLVAGAYKRDGVVFACLLVRMLLFSEARFQFRRLRNGRPGDLYGTAALRPLEQPWPGATTGDLLARMEQDASLAGNFFAARRPGGRIKRMRPDWVTIVLGSERDDVDATSLDAEVLGYLYHPGGHHSSVDPVVLDRSEVAHYAPIPDPDAAFRGMSWLTPVLAEVMADKAATEHKLRFFENGATPNIIVSMPQMPAETYREWVELFREGNEGVANAYKTLFLGGGADPKVVGADFKQLDFKITQGAGETRIAAAAGVPPVIVGLSEGLQAATYSNYGQARRRFADGTMRPLWRNAAGSLAAIVDVPPDSELWYDDRDIPFLQEDQRDAAEILSIQAQAIRTLIDGGFDPEKAVAAVSAGDLRQLQHTGLLSVQLRPPGEGTPLAGNGAAPAGTGELAAALALLASRTKE